MHKFLSGRLIRTLLVLSFAAVVFGTVQLLTPAVRAVPAQQTWFDLTKLPEIQTGPTLSYDDGTALFSQHIDMNGDRPCDAQDGDGCWYNLNVGAGQQVEQNGYSIKTADGTILYLYERFIDASGQVNYVSTPLVPTPNPNVALELIQDDVNSPYRMYFRTLNSDLMVAMPGAPAGAPFVQFLESDSDVPELTRDGQPWLVDDNTIYSQIGYSANGQWMSIWSQSGYVVVVNLNDFSTRTINVGAPIDFAVSTVSDDGRYLALNTTDGYLTLYDLSRCAAGGLVDGVAAESCPVRDVGAALGAYLGVPEGEPVGFGTVQFVEDDILKYTMQPDYQQYYIWAPNTTQPYEDPVTNQYYSPPAATTNYVALGDSYASGEGVGNSNFYPETNVSGVNQCHLSLLSYPYLIAADLGLDSVHSVACSGAKIANVLTNAQYPQVPSNNKLGSWLPGPKPQIQKLSTKTDIITISMVGNDIGFGKLIQRCVMESDTCESTYEDRKELVLLINNQFDRLVDTYTQLEQAAPGAHIYVIGYPSIVNPAGGCKTPLFTLNSKETAFAQDLISYLDSVIQKATQRAGVYYVNDLSVFEGHRICEGSSENRAVNGVTIEKPLKTNNSFHPTVFGHQLLAQWIEKKTYDFTEPLPRADYTVGKPTADDSLPILQAPKSGRPLNELNYDDNLSNDVVYRGTVAKIEHNVESGLAKAFSTVYGWLHSDPVYLGAFQTDAQGNFSADITIPASVPAGFHTLDFYVEGTDGQMQDITKTIYVAASPNDYDGDGVPNTLEPCLIFEVPDNQLSGDGYSCSDEAAADTANPLAADSVARDDSTFHDIAPNSIVKSSNVNAIVPQPKDQIPIDTGLSVKSHPSKHVQFRFWMFIPLVLVCLGLIWLLRSYRNKQKSTDYNRDN